MVTILSKVFLSAFILFTMSLSEPAATLNIMSFNIRYDNPGDGEHAWSHRKERVANIIHFYGADIFGLQEALYHQVQYIEGQFPDYQRVGVGRDDGKLNGEFSPIFFNTTILESIEQGTFWLSQTPNRPSKDWDAALPRIATWVLLRHLPTSDTLLFCNTHFDHRGEEARKQSAQLLVEKLPELAGNYPIILTGDFNLPPSSEGIQTMSDSRILRDAKLASQTEAIGPEPTFGGFEVTSQIPGQRIDYIFISNQLQTLRFATITEEQNGSYPSDHFPVFAEISW